MQIILNGLQRACWLLEARCEAVQHLNMSWEYTQKALLAQRPGLMTQMLLRLYYPWLKIFSLPVQTRFECFEYFLDTGLKQTIFPPSFKKTTLPHGSNLCAPLRNPHTPLMHLQGFYQSAWSRPMHDPSAGVARCHDSALPAAIALLHV